MTSSRATAGLIVIDTLLTAETAPCCARALLPAHRPRKPVGSRSSTSHSHVDHFGRRHKGVVQRGRCAGRAAVKIYAPRGIHGARGGRETSIAGNAMSRGRAQYMYGPMLPQARRGPWSIPALGKARFGRGTLTLLAPDRRHRQGAQERAPPSTGRRHRLPAHAGHRRRRPR